MKIEYPLLYYCIYFTAINKIKKNLIFNFLNLSSKRKHRLFNLITLFSSNREINVKASK